MWSATEEEEEVEEETAFPIQTPQAKTQTQTSPQKVPKVQRKVQKKASPSPFAVWLKEKQEKVCFSCQKKACTSCRKAPEEIFATRQTLWAKALQEEARLKEALQEVQQHGSRRRRGKEEEHVRHGRAQGSKVGGKDGREEDQDLHQGTGKESKQRAEEQGSLTEAAGKWSSGTLAGVAAERQQ